MTHRTTLSLESLEARANPVVTAEMTAPGVLTITSTDDGDNVSVSNSGKHDVGVYQLQYSGAGSPSTTVGIYSWVNKIVFYGNGGNDYFKNDSDKPLEAYGGSGQDSIWGGIAEDLIYGGADNDYLHGECGTDKLYGQGGGDSLYGDSEADFLYGGDGHDFLSGGLGDDYLSGGDDVDELTGGAGADTFVRDLITFPSGVAFNRDEPQDFQPRPDGDQMLTLRYLPPPPVGVYVPLP